MRNVDRLLYAFASTLDQASVVVTGRDANGKDRWENRKPEISEDGWILGAESAIDLYKTLKSQPTYMEETIGTGFTGNEDEDRKSVWKLLVTHPGFDRAQLRHVIERAEMRSKKPEDEKDKWTPPAEGFEGLIRAAKEQLSILGPEKGTPSDGSSTALADGTTSAPGDEITSAPRTVEASQKEEMSYWDWCAHTHRMQAADSFWEIMSNNYSYKPEDTPIPSAESSKAATEPDRGG